MKDKDTNELESLYESSFFKPKKEIREILKEEESALEEVEAIDKAEKLYKQIKDEYSTPPEALKKAADKYGLSDCARTELKNRLNQQDESFSRFDSTYGTLLDQTEAPTKPKPDTPTKPDTPREEPNKNPRPFRRPNPGPNPRPKGKKDRLLNGDNDNKEVSSFLRRKFKKYGDA